MGSFVNRVQLGDFELSVFSDGTYCLDGGTMFGVVPKVMWERKMPTDAQNRVVLGLNSLLIRTGKHNVLVETGVGNKLSPKLHGIYRNEAKLLDNLRAGGVDPTEVDTVINTHLHFDHCGWNTIKTAQGLAATFPNARYFAQRIEAEHGLRQLERDRAGYLLDNYEPLIESGQMTLLDGDQEIVPGISVRRYPGHTATMQAVVVRSGAETACYISDLIPTTAHTHLTWVMSYDLYPLDTIESRKRFYAEAIPQKWLVAFTHDPRTPLAYLKADKSGDVVAHPVGEHGAREEADVVQTRTAT